MDAVELSITVDVAAGGRLMGSEGFGKAGVTVEEVKGRESDRVSFIVSPSVERPSSCLSENRVLGASNTTEFASWVKSEETEFHKTSLLLPNVSSTEVPTFTNGNGPGCPAKNPEIEGVQSQRKVGKMIGNGGSCSRRIWTSQLVEFVSPKETEELKGRSDKPGSRATKSRSPEQRQLLKQKSYGSNKRGDWKNSKFHMKARFDPSSQKFGSTSFHSSSGGKNLFALYGLKPENEDYSEHMKDIPLNELLSGTYNCSNVCKDEGKYVETTNDSFLSPVRKAFSLIQPRKPNQLRNENEMDGSAFPFTLVPSVDSLYDDKRQSCRVEVSSDCKASCIKVETLTFLDWPLLPPKEVLEHLALPPSRDLESLLLDATKPSAYVKNADVRLGKQIARRPILPAFTWSHAFTGHCRSNSDTVKLSTSRSTCQGRWARILNIIGSAGVAGDVFNNLDSFVYDQSLVPSEGPRFANLCYKVFPSLSVPRDSQLIPDEYCPRILAAAQILCEIANQSSWPTPNGMLRCQKKCTQKVVRACNLTPDYKFEETLGTSVAVNRSEQVRSREQTMAAKKPRLMTFDNRGSVLFNCGKKGAVDWPTSRSSRLLYGKASKESNMEDKRLIPSAHKHSFIMPAPGKDLNKVSGGQRKVGKLVLMDWKGGRDHLR